MTDSKTVVEDLAAEVGTCDLCDQEMIRTADDCWHPWTVTRACPPEPGSYDGPQAWAEWRAAGNDNHRPGRQHFRPVERQGVEA